MRESLPLIPMKLLMYDTSSSSKSNISHGKETKYFGTATNFGVLSNSASDLNYVCSKIITENPENEDYFVLSIVAQANVVICMSSTVGHEVKLKFSHTQSKHIF